MEIKIFYTFFNSYHLIQLFEFQFFDAFKYLGNFLSLNILKVYL